MNGEKKNLCKHGTINRSNSRFRTMHVMTYIFNSSYSHQLQFVCFLFFNFDFFYISSAKHHKWTILYSSNVIYMNRGVGGGMGAGGYYKYAVLYI